MLGMGSIHQSLFVPVPQLFPETFVFFVFSFPLKALLGVLPEQQGAQDPVFAFWLYILFYSFSGEVLRGVCRNNMICWVVLLSLRERPGEVYWCNFWRVFLQFQNGSFIILKQLLKLYLLLVVSLRTWAFWVKACSSIVLYVLICAVFCITIAHKACLSSSRHFFFRSSFLSSLPSLGDTEMS